MSFLRLAEKGACYPKIVSVQVSQTLLFIHDLTDLIFFPCWDRTLVLSFIYFVWTEFLQLTLPNFWFWNGWVLSSGEVCHSFLNKFKNRKDSTFHVLWCNTKRSANFFVCFFTFFILSCIFPCSNQLYQLHNWACFRISLLAYSPLAMGILSGKYFSPDGGPADARLNLYRG